MSNSRRNISRHKLIGIAMVAIVGLTSCQWRGLNSLPMPGTEGNGDGSFVVQAQLPDVGYAEQNSRVRVGDVNVGTVTKIERQDWHALVTMRLDGNVDLPANATAKVGQTSLLGSLHVELAPPTDVEPQGKLHEGSLIPLANGGSYPNTDQTLAALSLLLNGGGIGQVQDITAAFATAFAGRENDLRSLIEQLNQFTVHLNEQKGDIIAATESFDRLIAEVAAQQPVLDRAIEMIPDALVVLSDNREQIVEAADAFGKFSALATDALNRTNESLVRELEAAAPVFKSLANAGPSLTRSLSLLATFPFPKETINNVIRGDVLNLTGIVDLTLSRIDSSLFTGTRWEGDLTELELQWGRTIGQSPSPYTAGNPLVVPYQLNQGP